MKIQTHLTEPQGKVKIPPRMKAALERYQKRVWTIKLAEGGLAAIFGILVSYIIVFCLDRVFDTPTLLRVLILGVGMVGMVFLLPMKYYNWVWKHRQLEGVARLLQQKFPRFGDHVLGIVELAQNREDQLSSPTLVEAAMRQVDAEVARHNLADAVPNPRHRRWAYAAALPLVLVVIGAVAIPATSWNTFARWLTPWRNVERYTFAQLEGESGVRVVPYAEPFDMEARLKEGSPWKPESGEARYANQTSVVATRDEATYRFQLPPQTRDGHLKLRVGDARRTIPIEPKLRPALTQLIAKVELPVYLQRSEPLVEDVRGGTLSLLKGSTAVLEATATRALAEATLNGRPQRVDGARVTTEPIKTIEKQIELQLAWRDRFGLAAREPQVIQLEAREDESPRVSFNKLNNNRVVLSSEVLTFEVQAGDDFGVKRVGLEWEGIGNPIHNPEPTSGEKTVASGTPTTDVMTVAATFSALRENVRPQSLRLRAFAEDYLPGRERVRSPDLVIHVLTPAEHFKWLVGQMELWMGAAQEVHDKELQLHETNRELRDLPPEALDDPAQRRKLQNQAAAERANAARLESLIQLGTELVQEATKNEEFDPNQLDSWAEILKKLEEIAGQRMPSVADLLARAAEAPGQSRSEVTSPASNQQESLSPASEKPPFRSKGEPNNLENVEKYGPERKTPPEGLDEIPEDPNIPGTDVVVNRSKQPDGKPGYVPANPTPRVVDVESGFNESEDASEQAPQVVGGLGIPVTTLKGSGRKNDEEEESAAPQTAELVLEAVKEQQELLDAFAALAEKMNKLLTGFENSTFVKRLKAASRRQIDTAVDLNNLDGFGQDVSDAVEAASDRERLAGKEVSESKVASTLLQDMAAYADRRPSSGFSRVLSEMQDAIVSEQMLDIAEAIQDNFIGDATIEAEFWADTLDRWAEQLVDPLPDGNPPPEEMGLVELPNLPPEIVVEVMRIINREIQLREETRELEQAKAALTADEYRDRSIALYDTQITLTEDTREVEAQISLLPNAQERFIQGQLAKVGRAAEVMEEVEDILAEPDTGPRAIAAITETIEILLETGRMPNAPMIRNAPAATASALMLLGVGDDSGKASIENRSPRQATGKTGRVLPEEFRQGLDAYFDALEGRTQQ
ncbi:hypothetical protein F4X88_02490 [Candidatus Poribacteria bacterium]|nr:hypothetical protein [Candidatus Poribacteria bacterium]MYA55140.1 hypothetical protein [Candidatus Poribacteria bacterium]